MPCYSYISNNPITFVGNVEIVTSYSGSGYYSYSTLAWICEFPIADQLKVYTRPTVGSPETLLVQGTDYTIDEPNNRINLTASVTAGYQIVIRRSTPSNRMIYKFVDGAKLTAKELNASFHQLLFLNQERDFLAGSTINNFYPVYQTMSTWTAGVNYTIGSFVVFGSAIYKCIQATTGSQNPIDNTYWQLVNNTQTPLIVYNGPNPVPINLTSLSPGKALVWNGNEFAAQSFTSSLSTLTDVSLAGLAAGDLLRYNGTVWVKATPSIQDITATNLSLNNRAFYGLVSNLSYTNNASSIDVSSKSFLLPFKSGTSWVLTDPPTVYHIVKNTLPNSEDPQTFFSQIRSELDGLSANVTNPIKLKFYWDLNRDRVNVADTAGTGDNLDNYKAYFWDSYGELYSTTGYGTTTGLKYHAVDDGTHLYKVSPFFYEKRLKVGGSLVQFTSKLKGYGIKHFYLSVPECHTTALANIPIAASNTTYFTATTNAALVTSLNAIGGDNEAGSPQRDLYLMGLRDMAFAAARPTPGANDLQGGSSTVKSRDAKVRYYKGAVLSAAYTNLADATYIPFENPNATVQTVLWKIPRQMIYYNKAALAFSNKDNAAMNTNSAFNSNSVRFQGYNSVQPDYTNAATFPNHNSSSAGLGLGTLFKANHYWSEWCNKWDTDSGDVQNYRYNEADIDWYLYNMIDGATNIGLYKTNAKNPPFTSSTSSSWGAGTELNNQGRFYFPWAFRPNDPRPLLNNAVGSVLFNIDSNKLFSESTNFLSDPEDEYVFRLVAADSLTDLFTSGGYDTLKTSIILEYGFNEGSNHSKTTPLTDSNLFALYPHSTYSTNKYRADSRIDYSKVRVFVKREALETTGTGASERTRYVITLAIRVPRIKSIGYARTFRRMYINSSVNNFPQRDSTSTDSELDSGPWTWGTISPLFSLDPTHIYPTGTFGAFGAQPDLVKYTGTLINGASSTYALENTSYGLYSSLVQDNPVDLNYPVSNWVSGRNECAVKFTRVGIPSTLWIRLSVLNTDGSVSLLDSSGFINVTG